jgi:hypothetical protein
MGRDFFSKSQYLLIFKTVSALELGIEAFCIAVLSITIYKLRHSAQWHSIQNVAMLKAVYAESFKSAHLSNLPSSSFKAF